MVQFCYSVQCGPTFFVYRLRCADCRLALPRYHIWGGPEAAGVWQAEPAQGPVVEADGRRGQLRGNFTPSCAQPAVNSLPCAA